jgi:hypothetical protein
MADQLSSTAAKKLKMKGRGIVKPFQDLFKRPKSSSAQVSTSSAFGAHDSVPGNDAGSAEATVSSKHIGSILVST